MQRLLSLVLPIRNVQKTLRSTVESILDSLGDQVARLEVILVEDGSTDDTPEVVFELTGHYPQVKALYHDTPRGWRQSVQHGLERASGEMILIREENCRLAIEGARRLFALAELHPLLAGTVRPVRWPHRWIGWHQSEVGGGFRLIVPDRLEALGHTRDEISVLATGPIKESAGWRSIPIADCPAIVNAATEDARYYRRSDAHPTTAAGRLGTPARPNFLNQVREFALGE